MPSPKMHTYVSAPDPHQPQTHTFVVSVTPRMLVPSGGASPAQYGASPAQYGASPRSPPAQCDTPAQYDAYAQYDANAQYDASAQYGRAGSPSNYAQYDVHAQYDASAQYGRAGSPSNYVDRVLQLPPGTTAAIQKQQQQQSMMREVGAVTGAPPSTFIAASYRRAEAERRDGLIKRRDERGAADGSQARHPKGARDDAHANSPAPAAALQRQSTVRASRPLSRHASAVRSGRRVQVPGRG